MINSDFTAELKPVLVAQQNILNKIHETIDSIECSFSKNDEHADKINELNSLLDEIESQSDLLLTDDIDGIEDEIQEAVAERSVKYNQQIKTINFNNWSDFVRESQVYCLSNKVEFSLPWEAFLTDEDLEKLKSENYYEQYKWDKWDYIFVGTAGVIASLTDFLLVKFPKNMSYHGTECEQSPITAFLNNKINSTEKSSSWFSDFSKELEKKCKVPYDAATQASGGLNGMYAKTHRLQSLGHDPLLGLVIGVLDIYMGTLTGFSYDKLSGVHSFAQKQMTDSNGVSLLEAFLTQIGHLVSDVGTGQGVPPPFFSLFQGINIPVPSSPKGRTVGEIARWMYTNGFDFRHFITQGITPAVIEIIVRVYIMIRHYSEKGEVKFVLADNPKYRSMLLSAHAIACAGNAGKVALCQGNPLAINYAEWLALTRYLLPSLKYWVFDISRLKVEHYQKINDNAWEELTISSDALLEKVYSDLNVVDLGLDKTATC